jgi:uncharacterized membrane protein
MPIVATSVRFHTNTLMGVGIFLVMQEYRSVFQALCHAFCQTKIMNSSATLLALFSKKYRKLGILSILLLGLISVISNQTTLCKPNSYFFAR